MGALPHLESALARLAALRDRLEPDAAGELEQLRTELADLKSMLNYAAAWHAAWARVLYGIACGYTAAGAPGTPPLEPHFSVHG